MPTQDAVPFRFSRESQIRIDRDGRFWHEGTRVLNDRLEHALATWVDVEDSTGRYVLKNALDWCYVAVDDTPLVVRTVSLDASAGGAELVLSDGSQESLVLSSLRVDPEGVVYCDVRRGRMPARFDRSAAFTLLECAEVGTDGTVTLRLGGVQTTVAALKPGETVRPRLGRTGQAET